MKMRNLLLNALLSILAVILLLPVQALAAGSIDYGKDVSLTILYKEEDSFLFGAKFALYKVAEVDEYGELAVTDAFRQFHVDIDAENDDAWKKLAFTLEGYVLRDGITPVDTGKTDIQGTVTFPNQAERLDQGLYLVMGDRHIQGGRVYDAAPFMVMLPSLDKESGEWVYDTKVKSKYDSSPEPDGSDTITRKVLKVWKDDDHGENRPDQVVVQLLRDGEVYDTVALNAAENWRHTWEGLDNRFRWTVVEKEMEDYTVTVTREGVTFVVTNTYTENPPAPHKPGKPHGSHGSSNPGEPSAPSVGTGGTILPQTGQLWWPVPILLAAGLLFVVLGLLRRRGDADET